MSEPKLRLVGVTVQAQVVIDDGDSLEPASVPPVVVSAKDWAKYSAEGFPKDLAGWQAEVDDMLAE